MNSLPRDSLSVTVGPGTDLRGRHADPCAAQETGSYGPLPWRGEPSAVASMAVEPPRARGPGDLGLLLLSTLMQSIRQSLGFGYPQLPS